MDRYFDKAFEIINADSALMTMTTTRHQDPRDDEAGTSLLTSSVDQSCQLYELIVCTLLIGGFCVFGLVGNATSFVVFCVQHKSDTAASAVLLLQCMAVFDSLLLVVAMAVYSVPAAYQYIGHLDVVSETFDYIVYVWPPAMIFHTVTVWLTVLVSINRYNAVCRAVEQFGTTTLLRRTRLHISVVVVLSVIYNIPRFFEHQVIHSTELVINATMSEIDVGPMILGDSLVYQIIYSNIVYYPVMYVVPLGTLAFLNIRLITALNAVKRRTTRVVTLTETTVSEGDVQIQQQRPRRRRKDDNITLCVIVIVSVFIVCQTPALFNQIFWAVFEPAERECGQFHFYYTKLSDLLVVVNSSCNFVVYCLFGPTFRHIFLSTACCCCYHRCYGGISTLQQQQAMSQVRTRLARQH